MRHGPFLALTLAVALAGCGTLPCTNCSYAVQIRNELGQPISYRFDDDPDRVKQIDAGGRAADLWSLPPSDSDEPRRTLRAFGQDGALLYCASFSNSEIARLKAVIVLKPGKTDCR